MINLTDELYFLFPDTKKAKELRVEKGNKRYGLECLPKPGNDSIWDILGEYLCDPDLVILCEDNILEQSEKLSRIEELNLDETEIYWAIEELVRLHEHAHHLFFCRDWIVPAEAINQPPKPDSTQLVSLLDKLIKRELNRQNLGNNQSSTKKVSKVARNLLAIGSILELGQVPRCKVQSLYAKDVIESVPEFVTHSMIDGLDWRLERVFEALDRGHPPQYLGWRGIVNELGTTNQVTRFFIPSLYVLILSLDISTHFGQETAQSNSKTTQISLRDLQNSLVQGKDLLIDFSEETKKSYVMRPKIKEKEWELLD